MQALGFTEEDSAGQSNIFAVEVRSSLTAESSAGSNSSNDTSGCVQPKIYVSSSQTSDSSATLIIGGVAAAIAAAILAVGVGANSANVSAGVTLPCASATEY